MPFGIPKGAICVQRFDDSLNSAIRITYRISLRSSSMPEPRDPLLKVFDILILGLRQHSSTENLEGSWQARVKGNNAPGSPKRQARQSNMGIVNKGLEVGPERP